MATLTVSPRTTGVRVGTVIASFTGDIGIAAVTPDNVTAAVNTAGMGPLLQTIAASGGSCEGSRPPWSSMLRLE
jgi:hypothetical protein